MMQSRIAALHPDTRRSLRAASILGETFWRGAVAALLDEPPAALIDRLDALERRELVSKSGPARFRGEDQYTFRHAVVRDAAYATLVDADRAVGHKLAAEWLVRAGELEAAVIAAHFDAGGDDTRAVEWHRRAAEQALLANDFAGAIEAATRAATRGAGGETLGAVRLVEAEACWWRADNESAERAATDALGIFREGSEGWFEAIGQLARCAGTRVQSTRLAELAERIAAAIASGKAGRIGLAVGARAGMYLIHVGNAKLARELLDRVDALAASNADPLLRAWIDRARSSLAMRDCDVAGHLARCLSSLAAFEEAQSARDAVVAEMNVAYAFHCVGHHVEAERRLRDALVRTRRLGMIRTIASCQHQLAIVLARRGDLEEAMRCAKEALEGLRQSGDQRLEGGARLVIAFIERKAGDAARAEEELRAALDTMPPRWHPWRIFATALLGELCLGRGALDEALSLATAAMDRVDDAGVDADMMVRLIRARTLDARGDRRAACEVLAVAKRLLLERASRLSEDMRGPYLSALEEHAQVLALAAEWGA